MPRPQSNAFQSTKSKSIKKRSTPVPKTSPAVDEGFDIVLENVQADGGISPAVAPQFSANAADMGGAPRSARRESFHSMLSPKEILDYTEKKTGLTPDDVSMILEMGYDSELSNLIGRDALKKLKVEHLRATRPVDKLQYATAFGYRNREYTGEESRELILANYVRDKKSVILRLALTAAITVMLLLLELPWFLGEAYGTYRQAAPWLFALLSLGGLVGAGVLSRKALGAGLRNFFRLTPSPYSVAGITFTVAAFVGILNVLLAGSESELISLNLPAAGVLLLTAICDTLRLSSEMRVFGILSAEDEKTVLEPAELHKQKLRHGDKIVKIINDDIDQNLYRLRRSRAISGFFRRCNESGSAARPFGLLLLISLTLSFLSGFLAAICGKGFSAAGSALLLTFFLSLPVPSVLLFFYPLCRANRKLTKRNCALVGEESVEEYSQTKTVIFGDKDLYTVRKCTQTMARDGDDFRRDLRLAGILFRQMDGALSMLDGTASEKADTDPHVTFVRLGETGTEAIIDNRYHLLAGNAKFLAKSGVRVPKESSDRTTARSENTALMYVAIDGVLKLTYEIEYEASDSFEAMVALLAEHGTYAAIRTYDPNLNDAFLQQSRAEGAEYVRVIKPSKHESRSPVEISDSGIVALGDQFDVTRALLSASLIQKIRRCGYFIQGAVSLAGAILATVLAFSLEQMLPGIPLMLALLFQGGAVLAAWIATRLTFRFGATENSK